MARSYIDRRFVAWFSAILFFLAVWGYVRIRQVYVPSRVSEGFVDPVSSNMPGSIQPVPIVLPSPGSAPPLVPAVSLSPTSAPAPAAPPPAAPAPTAFPLSPPSPPPLQPPVRVIGCKMDDDCNTVYGEGQNKCIQGTCECRVGSGTFCQLGPRRHPDPSNMLPEEQERFKQLRDLSTFTLQDYKNWLRLWRSEFWKLDDVHVKNLMKMLRGESILAQDIPLTGNDRVRGLESVSDGKGGALFRPARMDPPQYRARMDATYFSPTNLEDLSHEENADIRKLYEDALAGGGGMTLIETSKTMAERIEKAMKAEGERNALFHLIGSSVPKHPQELCVKGPAKAKLREHVERQLREKGMVGASLEKGMALFTDLDLLCSPELEYTLSDPKVLQLLMTLQAMSRDEKEPRTCREFRDYIQLIRKAIAGRGITLNQDQEEAFHRFQRAYGIPLDLAEKCALPAPVPVPAPSPSGGSVV